MKTSGRHLVCVAVVAHDLALHRCWTFHFGRTSAARLADCGVLSVFAGRVVACGRLIFVSHWLSLRRGRKKKN